MRATTFSNLLGKDAVFQAVATFRKSNKGLWPFREMGFTSLEGHFILYRMDLLAGSAF